MKKCVYCNAKIEGRVSKKYCNAHCRSAQQYVNIKNKEPRFLEVQKILRSNRKILKVYNKAGKSTVRADLLLNEGFNPNYFTNYWKNSKSDIYLFVYEFGFMKLNHQNGKKYLLIKWQSFMERV